MSDLYAVDVSTINYHLEQINDTGELHLSDVIRKIQIPSEKWDEQGSFRTPIKILIVSNSRGLEKKLIEENSRRKRASSP